MIQTLITDLSLKRVTGFDFTNTSSIVDFLAALKTSDWAIVSDTFKATPDVVNAITQYSPEIMRVNSIFGVLNISDLPLSNGWWPGVLIPILSGLSQFVSMKISMASQPQQTDVYKRQIQNNRADINSLFHINTHIKNQFFYAIPVIVF